MTAKRRGFCLSGWLEMLGIVAAIFAWIQPCIPLKSISKRGLAACPSSSVKDSETTKWLRSVDNGTGALLQCPASALVFLLVSVRFCTWLCFVFVFVWYFAGPSVGPRYLPKLKEQCLVIVVVS